MVIIYYIEVSNYEQKIFYTSNNCISFFNRIDKGVEMASIGTIYIPTTDDIKINEDDYIVEGIINDEFDLLSLQSKYQVFKVVSIDDNRKGSLQHFKIGVAE